MSLKTRNTMPPGGFPFEQKKADGTIHKFDGLTYGFNDQCKRIQDYRIGNNLMPTDLYAIGEELDAFQCERLGFDPRWCESKKNTSGWQTLKQSASHIVRAARHVAAGSKVIIDWLGQGGQPVAQELAQARADVCLKCPKNQEGHAVAKLTAFIAKAIHDQRREKLRMGLHVNGEERLHTCTGCDCHLPLKMWVPFATIENRTTDIQWKEFDPRCWMLKEGGRNNENQKPAPYPNTPGENGQFISEPSPVPESTGSTPEAKSEAPEVTP